MTCIVGITQDGAVYLGGDSASTNGYNYQNTLTRSKVFRVGDFVVGVAGSLRLHQLIRYSLTPPEHPDGMDTETYLATRFMDALRQCLKDGGHAKLESGEESTDSALLLGYRGRLFRVDMDYDIAETRYGFNAVGSGAEPAMGAFCATIAMDLDVKERLYLALDAAEQLNAAVRRPFTFETLSAAG